MKRVLGIFIFTVLFAALLGIFRPESFLSDFNLKYLARLIGFLSILAIGEALVIITGGIDLSVGSVVALSGVLVTLLMSPAHGYHPVVAIPIVLLMMMGVGFLQSQMVTRLKLQPFVVTLGGLMVMRGAAQIITDGGVVSLGNAYPGFKKLGSFVVETAPGGTGFAWNDPASYGTIIPVPVLILIVIAGCAHFLMAYTVFGQYLYAIGRNEEAARFSGIDVNKFKMFAYVICSGLACLTGILSASYLSSVQPSSLGNAWELYAIAAGVLGGVSLRGGEGTVLGIIVGAALMRLITNGISLWGDISSFWEPTVTGIVIIVAALMDTIVHRRGDMKKA